MMQSLTLATLLSGHSIRLVWQVKAIPQCPEVIEEFPKEIVGVSSSRSWNSWRTRWNS